MRTRALDRGWSLNEYRFSKAEGRDFKQALPQIHSESDIYRALDLGYIEPELREDRGEFEAAETGAPSRIDRMAEPARHLSLPHDGIAMDARRSRRWPKPPGNLACSTSALPIIARVSIQANGLDEKRLAAQVARIRKFNEAHSGIPPLRGERNATSEEMVSLDFPDEILLQLDYVVASGCTASLMLSEAAMTDRIIRAMGPIRM